MARARTPSPPRAAVLLASLVLFASALLFATPARAASACANTALTPRAGNTEALREAVLCLVNREREAHGESALVVNAQLTRAAQGHSEDMAGADYFSHYAPGGSSPLDRMRASGYIYSSQLGYEVGENIAWGTLWLASPQSIVSSWMASPEHRANILNAGYRETGIGVSPHAPPSMSGGQAGGLYTQDFGTIFSAGHTARHPSAHRHANTVAHPRTLSAERPLHAGSAAHKRHRHHHRRHHHRRPKRHRRRAAARHGAEPRSFQRSRHLGIAVHGSARHASGPHHRHRHHHRRRHHRRPRRAG